MRRYVLIFMAVLSVVVKTAAQGFYNLTAEEVKIDSVLPTFHVAIPLNEGYADSLYTVTIDYPEFIDMMATDIARYQQITSDTLPTMPAVDAFVSTSRRQGTLHVSFVPLVSRDGRYQKLVSFKLTVHATAVTKARRAEAAETPASRYADHSVLASGQWAKISVAQSGIHQLTESLIRKAGFSNLSRVKIYGYGGALQPEVLTDDYLRTTDDLKEVPLCVVGDRRLFYAVGPVGWSSATTTQRIRNPYSDYGYYFLTESDEEPLTVDAETFLSDNYPTADDYHELVEMDEFAWFHSGRNLYQNQTLSTAPVTCNLTAHDASGQLTVIVTYKGKCEVSIALNGTELGTIAYSSKWPDHTYGAQQIRTYAVDNLVAGTNTVTLTQTSGDGEVRLDYVALTQPTPAVAPQLDADILPQPQFVYRITNQDHHADTPVDMVIIIPTSQKLLAQAERLKQLHEEGDGLSVRIVPADELYNEFSSGTPDANAYRRYLKMFYDRAENENDVPRYLLLFGDGAWDNRMLTTDWRNSSPDDFLLCYESDDSFNGITSYVSDDYFCLLDDGEGAGLTNRDAPDVGVGRLPVHTSEQAKIVVDKIIGYYHNDYAANWQNVLMFIGDDGNNNVHMEESNAAAEVVESNYSGYNVKRVFFDAYDRVSTSTGNRYPDVGRVIKQQMRDGALIIDYCGHGAPYSISHEQVLLLADFQTQTSLRLPLWITASCDIMPFDSHEDNIGESAMLNQHGGAVAFYGTTRTVYVGANKDMNCSFIKHVLTPGNTMGDAVRLAKNEVFNSGSYRYNKLHYSLLGDPALALAKPSQQIVIDSINGQSPSDAVISLGAGSVATVKGHIVDNDDFTGVVSLTVKDVEEQIVCKLNNTSSDGASQAYIYNDRPNTIFNGTDSVKDGRFSMSFAVPRDISYNDESCQLIAFALNREKTRSAHGQNSQFVVGQGSEQSNDGIGPSIYCYLNSTAFVNGGKVNPTPYFFAQITDKEGINASGNGFGHDLELVVDGDMSMTYSLNNYFQYDFGDYRSGSVGFSLPELSEGEHRLLFRAWDVLNNPSTAELTFKVVRGLKPHQFSVECTKNPATDYTSFIINHDRIGSEMDVVLEVFDTSGRMLYRHSESGVSTDQTYTLNWDLTVEGGSRLRTGVYLYRVLISSDGSKQVSQAKKLIILKN